MTKGREVGNDGRVGHLRQSGIHAFIFHDFDSFLWCILGVKFMLNKFTDGRFVVHHQNRKSRGNKNVKR
jgi:hypothetical protein